MYKAICTDIDGTLLNANRQLSERTLRVLRQVKDKVPIILASSRMPAAMRHLQQEIGITNQPLICYNGGYVIDQQSGTKVISSTVIAYDWLAQVTNLANSHDLHSSIYAEDEWYAPEADFWTAREEHNTKVKASILKSTALLKLWNKDYRGAHKIMLMGNAVKIDAVVAGLNKLNAPLHLYRSKDTYLEIAPSQVSKAVAITHLAKQKLNIGLHEIIAFGDNFNDMDMLKAVGHGVVVANAKSEVKAVANEITDSGEADGVAKIIEKYFL